MTVEAKARNHVIIDASKPVDRGIRQIPGSVNQGQPPANMAGNMCYIVSTDMDDSKRPAAGSQKSISRVTASPEEIKKAYSTLSRFYSVVEGIFERGLRGKGLKLLAVKAGEAVLEIGFGTGYSLREIAGAVGENGKAYGIDITPEMLKITGKRLKRAGLMKRVELHEGDARRMPYKDNKFDAVYMAATLELFDTPDIPRVLKEIKRVLKPGGRLGVASLTREGGGGSLFLRFYEWLHRRSPRYISCRPIYLARSLKSAGYKVIKADRFLISKVAPYELVLAK